MRVIGVPRCFMQSPVELAAAVDLLAPQGSNRGPMDENLRDGDFGEATAKLSRASVASASSLRIGSFSPAEPIQKPAKWVIAVGAISVAVITATAVWQVREATAGRVDNSHSRPVPLNSQSQIRQVTTASPDESLPVSVEPVGDEHSLDRLRARGSPKSESVSGTSSLGGRNAQTVESSELDGDAPATGTYSSSSQGARGAVFIALGEPALRLAAAGTDLTSANTPSNTGFRSTGELRQRPPVHPSDPLLPSRQAPRSESGVELERSPGLPSHVSVGAPLPPPEEEAGLTVLAAQPVHREASTFQAGLSGSHSISAEPSPSEAVSQAPGTAPNADSMDRKLLDVASAHAPAAESPAPVARVPMSAASPMSGAGPGAIGADPQDHRFLVQIGGGAPLSEGGQADPPAGRRTQNSVANAQLQVTEQVAEARRTHKAVPYHAAEDITGEASAFSARQDERSVADVGVPALSAQPKSSPGANGEEVTAVAQAGGTTVGTLPLQISPDDLVSVRLADLISLFEDRLGRPLFVWLKSSSSASEVVTVETLKSAGIHVDYDAETRQVSLSISPTRAP